MRGILRPGPALWCERPLAAAGLLVDGEDYYRAFYRAACQARRYILIAGWQFDSEVPLLRGEGAEAEAGGRPVTLRAFLSDLCERNPDLSIYLLAWDFHVVFALEREWLQQLIFAWTTNERLSFRFDASHVENGCHHQKFVVIDGELSFVGGLDICDHRWDDRRHREANPLRQSRGAPHKPFHDVQSYLVGRDVARALASLFDCRWQAAGGGPLSLPRGPRASFGEDYRPPGALPLLAPRVALSRTDPRGAPTDARGCREVYDLYREAIAAAERLIYVETQYFSSRAIGEALEARLRDPARPPLDVVLILNMRAETLKEEIAVGLAQAKVLAGVRAAAAGTAHRLGIYYTVPEPAEAGREPARATYIHSKVMAVDDLFLTVGSANLTNRSFSVDTELNASFEADGPGDPLAASIAAARRSLLAEHLGLDDPEPDGALVPWLDDLAARRVGRLRPHPSPTERETALLGVIDPSALPFDPDAAEDDEERRSFFAIGTGELWRRLFGDGE
ncbi:MAG TPA: phospholipase D-like domain-containing protein [Polyangiaceae bacterium]|nr:phospholipase D-like domain-containing protein [Polyangiaceae bacterium]